MAVEKEINTKMDLTLEEAVKERLELFDYLNSEKWTYSVVEKVERRLADLNNLIADMVTNEMVE